MSEFAGCFSNGIFNWVTPEMFVLPSSLVIYELDQVTPAALFTDRTMSSPANNAPIDTEVAVGQSGIDGFGNLTVFAEFGFYYAAIGSQFFPIIVPPDPFEPNTNLSLFAPNGSIYNLAVDNAGNLTTVLGSGAGGGSGSGSGGTGGGTSGVFGAYKPDSTTTGVPSGSPAFTMHTGDITVTVAGTVLDLLDVHGRVKIQAANVTVKRCYIRGTGMPGGTANSGLVVCTSQACVNATIEDCHLTPDTPIVTCDGVIGHDYTAQRNNVFGCVDGFGVYNNNSGHTADKLKVTIQGNYVHDMSYISPDPNHTSDNHTHNDGVQIQGGYTATNLGSAYDVLILGNTLLDGVGTLYSNATSPYAPACTGQAIAVTPNVGNCGNIGIEKNWLDGGAQCITIIIGTGGTVTVNLDISNNVFGDPTTGLNTPSLTKNGVTKKRAILIDSSIVTAAMSGWTTGNNVTDTHGNILATTLAAITVDSYAGAS